jgi:hypothetical protein
MTVSDKTRKLLWGRSVSRCAFCRSEVIMDATSEDDESVVGDECHIVSGKPKGPRYDSEFPVDEIDSYTNLILLCRVHHKMIDDQSETFSADILRKLKENHEKWVADALESASLLEGLSTTRSNEAAFLKVKASMPELIAEMKEDLSREGDEVIREFFIVSKRWALTVGDPSFIYYFEDHPNLQGKLHILENYGFVIDVTPGNAKKYRMTEEFIELITAS